MASTLVIKVRYADTLRRFNAFIREDGQLALNLEVLRAKVLGLFKFPHDAEIGLTYVDEDGDIVTLVDDSDLQDVMRQNLKFLRVDVNLKTEKDVTAESSCSSTPLRSPAIQKLSPPPNVASNVTGVLKTVQPALSALPLPPLVAASGSQSKVDLKILKSVQKPLYEGLSKLSLGLASDAGSSSAPVPTDFVDSLSKTTQKSQSVATNASPQTKDADVPTVPYGVSGASGDGGLQEDLAKSNASIPSVSKPSKRVSSAPVDLNLDPPTDSSPLVENSAQNKATGKATKEESDWVHDSAGTANLWGFSCPFSGVGLVERSYTPPPPLAPHFKPVKPFKRSHSRNGGLFHQGIQCDGCGQHPIAGPRYKSTVKENYDLCTFCFSEIGNEADYVKMNKPMICRHSWSSRDLNWPASTRRQGKYVHPRLDSCFISDVNVVDGTVLAPCTPFTKIWRLRNNGGLAWPKGTRLVWTGGDKFSHTNYSANLEIPANGLPVDAELDVAIDFTSPVLSGRYVSYWRMVSPSGTKFGQHIWVLIHVDASQKVTSGTSYKGLNLNLLPDFIAASKSPEAVVDGSSKPSASALPSEELVTPISDQTVKSEQDKNFPVNDALFVGNRAFASWGNKPGISRWPTPMINIAAVVPSSRINSQTAPTVAIGTNKPTAEPEDKKNFPVYDAWLVENHASAPPGISLRPIPIPDITAVRPSSRINSQTAPTAAIGTNKPTAEPEDAKVDDGVEESLLKELAEMGFKQVSLNKEILRMNEYDLDQSLDDLCGEWDPILEELKEMGFCDKEMNKKLLMKNNGSIKRVVMDLLTGERT